jgi:hypothetical protein
MSAHRKYPLIVPSIVPSPVDIAWAAGFIEGDGHIGRNSTTAEIDITQLQRWPLEKMASLFGGSIGLVHKQGVNKKTYNRWRVTGQNARVLARLIYPYLSPEKQIQAEGLIA